MEHSRTFDPEEVKFWRDEARLAASVLIERIEELETKSPIPPKRKASIYTFIGEKWTNDYITF
jgi:hypothetical protein